MPPDFDRDVHCLLGLPFDAIGMDAAVARVQRAAERRERCFLSTPNLNFAIAAQRDAAFRGSVWASDLSLVDGMPLVWIAKALGLPLTERVAGASLFERLRQSRAGAPIKVFFFGGAPGVAAAACERLNAARGGVACVGIDAPGFEPVEAMSGPERLAAIDASGADFLVVALGAVKGQAWIQRNRHRLRVPVISHLGAVVNFVAGTVRRAPPAWQRIGLEWLWRVGQEPALARRYAADGFALLGLLITRVLPAVVMARWAPPRDAALRDATATVSTNGEGTTLALAGAWMHVNLAPMRRACAQAAQSEGALRIEASRLAHVDAAAIALLGLLWADAVERGRGWRIDGLPRAVARQFERACAGCLLQARNGGGQSVADVSAVSRDAVSISTTPGAQ